MFSSDWLGPIAPRKQQGRCEQEKYDVRTLTNSRAILGHGQATVILSDLMIHSLFTRAPLRTPAYPRGWMHTVLLRKWFRRIRVAVLARHRSHSGQRSVQQVPFRRASVHSRPMTWVISQFWYAQREGGDKRSV